MNKKVVFLKEFSLKLILVSKECSYFSHARVEFYSGSLSCLKYMLKSMSSMDINCRVRYVGNSISHNCFTQPDDFIEILNYCLKNLS